MKKVYLTGVAASGKSTLLDAVSLIQDNIMVISYSEILKSHISKKIGSSILKNDLRRLSSEIVQPDDIEKVDSIMVNLIENNIKRKHIIVDSHATTIEDFGIRTTPFKKRDLKRLDFDILISLYAEPEQILERIYAKGDGRKSVSLKTIDISINIQNTILLHYGEVLEKSVYFLDSSKALDYQVKWLLDLINN